MTRRSRQERAELLRTVRDRMAAGAPLRQVAADLGVARRTLRGWLAASLPGELAAALATPAGQQWLARLVVALHLVITLRAAGGVRLVCECLTSVGWRASSGPPAAASGR